MEIYIVKSSTASDKLQIMINNLCQSIKGQGEKVQIVPFLQSYKNKTIIFACDLDNIGRCEYVDNILRILSKNNSSLENSVGSFLIAGEEELFTKSYGRELIFLCNRLGMRFTGRPIVEASKDLINFKSAAQRKGKSRYEILKEDIFSLGKRLINYKPVKKAIHNIAVIHACSEDSNTLALWGMVKEHLKNVSLQEVHIENGDIRDCKGCSYTVCKHFGTRDSCFYGGVMVDEVYPAILAADTIIFLCPNYNDAISANMTAMINRLTALFRKIKLYNKNIFAIIVSGHSGSDIIAKQLISALCINKTIQLPPYFAMMEIANNPGDIYALKGIKERASLFARKIEVFPWSHF